MLIKTEKSEAVMDFLKQKFLVNENIIGVIENMPSAEIFVDDVEHPSGVLVKKDDYMHYIYTEKDAFVDDMCENYLKVGFFGFSGVEGALAEKIRSRFLLGWESPCTLYYMPKENFDGSLKKNDTQRIKLEDAETVNQFYQYRDPWTLEIIKRDITNRPSAAIYINGEIACWVLIHDDSSMGIMYTKEEHRRKGYAVDVTIDLAQQIFEKGKIPFIQIVKGNGMSPGLARKCGFVEAGKADWFGIIAGIPKELVDANNNSRKQFIEKLPENLKAQLMQETKPKTALFHFLHNFQYQAPITAGISLIKADSVEEKTQWSEITLMGLCPELWTPANQEALAASLSEARYSQFILMKDGAAIAAATTQKDEDQDRGIYLVSVLPEYSETEIAAILINEILHDEKNAGCHFSVIQTKDDMKQAMLELGFRESHKI